MERGGGEGKQAYLCRMANRTLLAFTFFIAGFAFCKFTVKVSLHTGWWQHEIHEIKASTTAPSRAGRYLLFTTQRSGSTWFCDVLDRQPGVQCGVARGPNVGKPGHSTKVSEMMIKYSYMKHRVVQGYDHSTVPWAKWRADSEVQWARLTASHKRDEIPVIGYKLMYDQVPPRLVNEFIKYVVEGNISVVHLEREAVLLQVASHHQTKHKAHDTNASSAAATRTSIPPLAIPFATVEKQMKAKLAEHRAWTDRLRYTPGVRYYHVAYEQLTGAAAENYLRSVVAFVLDKGVDINLSSLSMASELNRLHEASCRKRVAPWLYALVRKAFGGPDSSAPRSVIGACDVLDAREAAGPAAPRPQPTAPSLP